MNFRDAIKSTVAGYPLSVNTFDRILIDRDLSATADYTGSSRAFELATADIYKTLVTAANITELDVQISMTDKSNFIKMANAIYAKYDEPLITEKKAIVVPRGKAPKSW